MDVLNIDDTPAPDYNGGEQSEGRKMTSNDFGTAFQSVVFKAMKDQGIDSVYKLWKSATDVWPDLPYSSVQSLLARPGTLPNFLVAACIAGALGITADTLFSRAVRIFENDGPHLTIEDVITHGLGRQKKV